jgi:hypothetical protein
VPTAFIITNITWTGNWVQGTAKNLTIALSDNAAIGAPYTYSVPAWLTVNSVVTNTEGVLVLSVTPTSYGNLSGNITVTASGVGTPTTPAYSISLYASVPSITAQIGDIYEPTRTSSFITNYGSTIVVGGLYNGGSSEFDVITQSDSYPTNTYFSFNKIGALVQTFASNGGAISPGHPYKYFYGTYGITNVTRKTNHEVSDFDYYVVITYSEIGIYGGTRGTATYSIHSKNEGIIGTASVDFDFYPVYSGPPLTGIFVGRTRPVSIEFGFLNGVATIGVYTNVGWSYFVSTQVPSTGYYAAMISPAIENNNAVVPVTLAQTSYAGHWIAG